ncbi:MAG: hypothetical protein AABW49_01860 [Nanoarchaeota archaeon]
MVESEIFNHKKSTRIIAGLCSVAIGGLAVAAIHFGGGLVKNNLQRLVGEEQWVTALSNSVFRYGDFNCDKEITKLEWFIHTINVLSPNGSYMDGSNTIRFSGTNEIVPTEVLTEWFNQYVGGQCPYTIYDDNGIFDPDG